MIQRIKILNVLAGALVVAVFTACDSRGDSGKSLRIMEKNLTFHIDKVTVEDEGINITLLADKHIPFEVHLAPGVKSIKRDMTLGMSEPYPLEKTDLKIPDEIIVYNNDNKSIKFKSGDIK